VGRRESHDAAAFYARFPAPEISAEDTIAPHAARNVIWCADARDMDAAGDIADESVALVVTSPPYFAGKEYEQALGHGHVPASYAEYLAMLAGVFAECKRKLEPGGRLAVNVANLGRRPYRSLSADVSRILEELGLLLRGEIIWRKQQAASGSCAWGTYQRPANPVLRDLTERVIVASKGRFDRALSPAARRAAGWPHEGSMSVDDFVDATTDVWELGAESARRVGHPAPFPIELPQRLIELYTYRGDLVLDPFMGSGATALAALRTGRYYVGFDTDPAYVRRAQERIAAEVGGHRGQGGHGRAAAKEVARLALTEAGYRDIEAAVRFADVGLDVSFRARDAAGRTWLFELAGGFSPTRPGLRKPEVLWRTLGKASVLHNTRAGQLVLLTTELPAPGSAAGRALRAITEQGLIAAAIALDAPEAVSQLAALAARR